MTYVLEQTLEKFGRRISRDVARNVSIGNIARAQVRIENHLILGILREHTNLLRNQITTTRI